MHIYMNPPLCWSYRSLFLHHSLKSHLSVFIFRFFESTLISLEKSLVFFFCSRHARTARIIAGFLSIDRSPSDGVVVHFSALYKQRTHYTQFLDAFFFFSPLLQHSSPPPRLRSLSPSISLRLHETLEYSSVECLICFGRVVRKRKMSEDTTQNNEILHVRIFVAAIRSATHTHRESKTVIIVVQVAVVWSFFFCVRRDGKAHFIVRFVYITWL